MARDISIPQRALVVLCGPSAVGKSTWARHHFTSSQIISSDRCRRLVADDLCWHEPGVSDVAFDLLYHWTEQRLRLNRLVVLDSTALMAGTRQHLRRLARRWHAPAVLAVFKGDADLCERRDTDREPSVGMRVLRGQFRLFEREEPRFASEHWDQIITLSPEDAEHSPVRLVPLAHERPDDAGPFDIIGDVHGCLAELQALLAQLGWQPDADGLPAHPDGRRLIFTGDLGCGGADTVGAWQLALRLHHAGRAEILVGDHDVRFARLLSGKTVALDRGLDRVALDLRRLAPLSLTRLRRAVMQVIASAPPHLLLDGGRLAVAHAALADHMVGKSGRAVRNFCRHGEGPRDPARGQWVARHRGHVLVVHGHAPTARSRVVNHTLNLDTGCVLGGRLTAFRWPERTLVQVPAGAVHWGDGFATSETAALDLPLESAAC